MKHSCNLHGEYDDFFQFASIQNVLSMTGTPIINKPEDVYPLLHIMDPSVFYSEYQFQQQFCYRDEVGHWNFRPGGQEALARRLRERYLVRDRKQAGIVLPPQEIQYHNIEFDAEAYPEQYKVLKMLTESSILMLEEDAGIPLFYILELILRKRQATLWPHGIFFKDSKTKEVKWQVSVDESIKIDRLIDKDGNGLIPELTADGNWGEGERVILLSQFKQPLKEISRRLQLYAPKISHVVFDGDLEKSVEGKAISKEAKIDFDANYCRLDGRTPKWQVLLGNFKKGGISLNFTDATQMIITDEEWSPGKNAQGYGRIDRIGQTKETTVHILRVNNSIDTWMAALIERKRNMIEGFESEQQLQQQFLDGLRNGDIL